MKKIRANVYDIFCTILLAAVKTGNGNADAVQEFFRKKMKQIPASWEKAYDKASEHGDAEQMQIENIKLETAQMIEQKFSEIWEENK